MPADMTTDIFDQLARRMHIPYFKELFMRNALTINGV